MYFKRIFLGFDAIFTDIFSLPLLFLYVQLIQQRFEFERGISRRRPEAPRSRV
jgi:hypothetical protein